MGTLMDDLRASPRAAKGPACNVRLHVRTMTDDDRSDLLAAIADDTITIAAIDRALRARDIKIGETSLLRHRRGLCATCGAA